MPSNAHAAGASAAAAAGWRGPRVDLPQPLSPTEPERLAPARGRGRRRRPRARPRACARAAPLRAPGSAPRARAPRAAALASVGARAACRLMALLAVLAARTAPGAANSSALRIRHRAARRSRAGSAAETDSPVGRLDRLGGRPAIARSGVRCAPVRLGVLASRPARVRMRGRREQRVGAARSRRRARRTSRARGRPCRRPRRGRA